MNIEMFMKRDRKNNWYCYVCYIWI